MSKPIAVVTGHEGFIGRHMKELLEARGYEVRGFDKVNPQWQGDAYDQPTGGNILSLERGAFAGATYVFHFAGLSELIPSISSPAAYMETNMLGTVRCLEAAREAGVKKFVYAASSSCYGANPPTPTRENAPILCEHPYAASKWAGEAAALAWHRFYGLPVNSLRIFNAYGRGIRASDNYGAVMAIFIRQRLSGDPLTVVGDGTQTRDFVHVKDVCRAFLMAAETEHSGKVWNLGYGQPVAINWLAKLIGGEKITVPKRPAEPDAIWADIGRIKRELGWSPEISFETGIAELLHHKDDFAACPLWTPEKIRESTNNWFSALA